MKTRKSDQYLKDRAKRRAKREATEKLLKQIITPRKLGLKNS